MKFQIYPPLNFQIQIKGVQKMTCIRMKPVNIILKGTLTKSYLPKTGEKEVVSL